MKNHFEVAKEEIEVYGLEEASLQSMLAILIGPKAEPEITGTLAGLGINQLMDMGIEDLKNFKGIGEIAARRIVSSFGLANYIQKFKREESFTIKSPEDAAFYFSDLALKNQEHFEAIYLNTKNVVISRKMIFKGGLNSSIVHPREVFKEGIKVSAASLIVSHNHPSGNATPSPEDIEVTKRLIECGEVMGIELLDHVIIGSEGKYVSLKEKGYI